MTAELTKIEQLNAGLASISLKGLALLVQTMRQAQRDDLDGKETHSLERQVDAAIERIESREGRL
jgi:hypothetical protein